MPLAGDETNMWINALLLLFLSSAALYLVSAMARLLWAIRRTKMSDNEKQQHDESIRQYKQNFWRNPWTWKRMWPAVAAGVLCFILRQLGVI
jgi:hypothetical protein